jgi:hypothetical protein
MHHSHVKRKEMTMNAYPTENLKLDPATLAVLHARARKARSEFVHSLVVRLIHRLTPDLSVLRTHWG